MAKLFFICTIFVIIFFQTTKAQDSIPLLKGKVTISITKGTIDCDFTLSSMPRIEDYVIRINSGMNILYFKNLDANNLIYFDKSFSDTLSSGESNAYYFGNNKGNGKFLPHAIQFRYMGMYPVVKDTLKEYSVEDWKGNIAFNGYSVRTDGRQSAWYPVLYDIKRDLVYEKVKCDIEVNCADCNTIYISGNPPVKSSTAHFKNDVPTQLTMYSGKYKVANVAGTYFLNPDINDKQLKEFGGMTNAFKAFYESKIGIPYKDAITYIQTTPTSKYNAWMFVSYPSIVNIGYGKYGLISFFDKKTGDWFKPYMAHELGHYYFGTVKIFNAELGDMMSEGFAEYLSLQVTRELINDSIYKKKITEKIKALKDFSAVAMGKVRSKSDYRNRELYVYYYAPLIFTAIEKEIGLPKMWQWIKAIIETKTAFTNYDFLEKTLASAVQDDTKMGLIKSKYLNSDKAVENATAIIQQQ